MGGSGTTEGLFLVFDLGLRVPRSPSGGRASRRRAQSPRPPPPALPDAISVLHSALPRALSVLLSALADAISVLLSALPYAVSVLFSQYVVADMA
eukprot:3499503-Rhodomonas_salina.8